MSIKLCETESKPPDVKRHFNRKRRLVRGKFTKQKAGSDYIWPSAAVKL